jgi:hypothetical protein
MQAPNGVRYPRVGGTRQRHCDGTNFQPRKRLENAQSPTRRVHAVLGSTLELETSYIALFNRIHLLRQEVGMAWTGNKDTNLPKVMNMIPDFRATWG